MNELTTTVPEGIETVFEDYRQYKKRLDIEIRDNVEGFVRIGYLLKIARDTNILAESNYKTLAEFAQAEYGMTKDVVSRYVAVNDRYSKGGYSDQLEDRYKGYGIAKLAEMLTLPDEVIAEIGPSLTRKEIQTIKREIAEEEKITPIEVAMEAAAPEAVKDDQQYSLTQRIWKNYLYDNREIYKQLDCKYYQVPYTNEEDRKKAVEIFLETIAPSGNATLFSRIPGIGKIMIMVDAEDQQLTYMNTRTNEKEKVPVTDAVIDIADIFLGALDAANWKTVYGEDLEETKEPEIMPEPVAAPSPAKDAKSMSSDMPSQKNAADRQQDTGHKAAEPAEKSEEVVPVQPEKEKAVAETPDAEAVAEDSEKLAEIETMPLRNITDVKFGDKLVNLKDGRTGIVKGLCAGELEVIPEGSGNIILVGPEPNNRGWAILLDEGAEKTDKESEQNEADGQQDTDQEDGICGLRNRIFEKEHEFEEVFLDAYADGFTVDGLKSVTRQLHQLKVLVDSLLDYKIKQQGEESEGNEDESD